MVLALQNNRDATSSTIQHPSQIHRHVIVLSFPELIPGNDRPHWTELNAFAAAIAQTFENAELIASLDNCARRTHIFTDGTTDAVVADDVDLTSNNTFLLILCAAYF